MRWTKKGGHGGPPHYIYKIYKYKALQLLVALRGDYAACEVCGIAIEPAPTRIGRITRL
jgi:hypothetical protein